MNKVIFCGNISSDIELRNSNNLEIATFNVAVQRKYKNNEGKYETDFFKLTAFNKNAQFINKYFSKGMKILVESHVQNRKWEDENGQKRYATDFIVDNVEFCGSKKESKEEQHGDAWEPDNVTVNDDELPF